MMRLKENKGYARASDEDLIKAILEVFRREGGFPQTVRHYFYALLGYYIIVHGGLELGSAKEGEEENLGGNGYRAYKNLADNLSKWRKEGRLPYRVVHDISRKREDAWHYNGMGGFLAVAVDMAMRASAWDVQGRRLLITVEKEGLKAAVHRVADRYRVPVLATKGFISTSALKTEIADFVGSGRGYTILHLGDHDPSGLCIDSSMRETLEVDMGCYPQIERIALTEDQARELPDDRWLTIKGTDARSEGYRERHGDHGWELDALPAPTFQKVIREAIEDRIDMDVLNAIKCGEKIIAEEHKRRMKRYAAKFTREVTPMLERELGAGFTYRVFGDGVGLWTPGITVLPEPEEDD